MYIFKIYSIFQTKLYNNDHGILYEFNNDFCIKFQILKSILYFNLYIYFFFHFITVMIIISQLIHVWRKHSMYIIYCFYLQVTVEFITKRLSDNLPNHNSLRFDLHDLFYLNSQSCRVLFLNRQSTLLVDHWQMLIRINISELQLLLGHTITTVYH